jgi:hypothetical protein
MSRTYRRRGQRHDYDWVLRDSRWVNGVLVPFWIHPRSKEGRRAIARFHSDAFWTLRSTAPRRYRRVFDHCQRTLNTRQLRRWLDDPSHDPVFEVRHKHCANWAWW